MTLLLPFALLASSATLVLQAPSSAAQEDHVDGATESTINTRVTCRQIGETGSRLMRRRICMTHAAWADQERTTRGDLQRWQRGGSDNGMTPGQANAALRQCPRC